MKQLSLLLLIVFVGFGLNGQIPNGVPYSKFYSADEYDAHSQNFDMVQGNDGIYFFANVRGVLGFDGENWFLVELKNKATCLSLTKSKDGTIYVGGGNELGVLKKDESKGYVYQSYRAQLDSIENLGQFWHSFELDDAIYYCSFRSIVRYKDNQLSIISNGERMHLTHKTPSNIFTFIGQHIQIYKDGKHEMVDTNRYSVFGLHEVNPETYYLFDSRQGILRLQLNETEGNKIVNVESPLNDSLNRHRVYDYVNLSNGLFAVSTLQGGVYVLDNELNIVNRFFKNVGLDDKMCLGIRVDKENNLWVMTSEGIVSIEYNVPFGVIDLQKDIKDLAYFNGLLYVATDIGLYTLDVSKYSHEIEHLKKIDLPSDRYWALNKTREYLYAASSRGVYEVDKENKTRELDITPEPVFDVRLMDGNDSLLLIGKKEGFSYYNLKTDTEVELGQIDQQVRFISKDLKNKGYWLTSRNDGIIFLNPENNNITKIDTLNGLKSTYETYVFEFDGRSVLSSDSTFEEIVSVFPFQTTPLPSSLLKALNIVKHDKVYRVFKEAEDTYWFSIVRNEIQTRIVRIKKEGNKFVATHSSLKRLLDRSIYSFENIDDNVYLGMIGGLGVFNKKAENRVPSSFNALISAVYLGGDSSRYSFYPNKLSSPAITEYTKETYGFHFCSPLSTFPDGIVFSYKLEGFDEKWSDWTKETKKEYTNLFEQDYVFKVRAKNVFDEISEEASFAFTVLPPIYRKKWMYVIYFLSVVGLGVIIAKVYFRKLHREKLELEKLVTERTKEVVAQKEKVERQNEDILASIHYAKHLQDAILPKVENEYFKDHFILFMPRDVVSGDFYWKFETDNYYFLAAIDCTGHGVPGAFVSITAFNTLNRIIRDKNILEPGEILSSLNNEVKEVFQNQGDEKAQDGMDLSLVRIKKGTREVVYAGAQNPLWIIRDKDIAIHKANKVSIGGMTDFNYKFDQVHLDLLEEDFIYLFTDGYVDQFGGEKDKKFKSGQLKKMLLNISVLPAEEQSNLLKRTFDHWKGEREQVDDVLIIGVKF